MFYSYMRVSTSTQAEANGIQMQASVISDYCKSNNIHIENSFQDLGISGTIVDRDGLLDMLSTLSKGDTIIVQNTSRLWRSDFAKVMIIQELKKLSINVISIEQPTYNIYTKDPNEFLINSMFELLDQYERMSIAMKLSKGRKAKSRKGSKACGVLAFGYKWLNAEVEIDYNNNLIVKDIFAKYLELQSLQKVVDYCKLQGYKTSRGNDFSKSSIKTILNNDFYIGIVRYNDKATPGTHETFIDVDTFNKVQELLSAKYRKGVA